MNKRMPKSEPPKAILSLEGQDRLFMQQIQQVLNLQPDTPETYRTFNIIHHMVIRQIVDCYVANIRASVDLLSKMPIIREFEDTAALNNHLAAISSPEFKHLVQRFGMIIFNIIRKNIPESHNYEIFLENVWDNAIVVCILMDDQTGNNPYGRYT